MKRRMIRAAAAAIPAAGAGLLILAFLGGGGRAAAYQWPISSPLVYRSFASPEESGFFPGLRLGSRETGKAVSEDGTGGVRTVRPVDEGEILFRQETDLRELPFSSTGALTVVQHRGGLRSFYTGLEFSPARTVPPDGRVTPYTVLGEFSGAADPVGFYLFDMEKNQYVNPFLVLPVFPDREKPQVSGLVLENEEGEVFSLRRGVLEAGVYRLRGQVSDSLAGTGDSAVTVPYSVSLYLNGNGVRTVTFDALHVQEGKWKLASLEKGRFSEVYGSDGSFLLGEVQLNTGRNILEIILRDIAGNETVRTYRMEVR